LRSPSPAPTYHSSRTPTRTPTGTRTPAPSRTPTARPTHTPPPTATPTETFTPTPSPTPTAMPTVPAGNAWRRWRYLPTIRSLLATRAAVATAMPRATLRPPRIVP
jgi:hypothetical protein